MGFAAGALILLLSIGCSRPPLPAEQLGIDAADEAPAFLAVTPCLEQGNYLAGRTVVSFGFLSPTAGFGYDPKCLAIDTGDTVTFSGSFAAHPLYPSETRGTVDGNPIGGLSTGESKNVTFPHAGFFAYYCGVHGAADDGSAMAGVIWAR